MKPSARSVSIWSLALASLALSGCSDAPAGSPSPVASTVEPILNGAPTNDPKYAAIGSLVIDIPFDPEFSYYDVICSATLIAPQAMITAKHCTPWIDMALELGGIPYFAVGSDGWAPEQLIPITGYVSAPPSKNFPALLLRGGRDIAVAYLDAVPEGIEPVKLGHFKEEMLGTQFEIAGFGYNEPFGPYGEKFVGPATARAQAGRWYSLLFNGDKQAYLDWYFTDAQTNPTAQEAEIWWDIYRLEPHYEVLAGGLPGEALGCFGDSGGPFFKGTNASDLTLYGVSFATEASLSTQCTLGGAYTVFNKHMLDFVKSAIQ